MNINKAIIDALKPLNVPVSFQIYNGTADTYITIFCYLENGELYADDIQKGTGYYMQVDVWSKTNYTNIVEQIKSAMTQADFSFLSAYDLYENDTKIYHKAMRFYYLEV